MDILAQALDVAEQAEAATGLATLTFDLNDPAHRTAYAAALAVLRMSGVDEDALTDAARSPVSAVSSPRATAVAPAEALAAETDPLEHIEGDATQNAQLWRGYLEALKELSKDEARVATVARDTFGRVVELLRDGANVEAVAQIQYRRWVEEHLDAVR